MKKLNGLNKSNKKRNFIVISAFLFVCLLVVGISYAVYQKTDEIQFINAKVGSFDTSNSDIELAMTLDGIDIDTPPSKNDGYYNVVVECDYADGVWDKDEWLVKIDNINSKKIKCNVNFEKIERESLSIVELGDYISMTPTATSYTPPKELTGCLNDSNCTQNTINPSELNLWRVIKKNEDGTVDAVSEYVSSMKICFNEITGYNNFVGALNEIASQYTNTKYVSKIRHMGYSNQKTTCSCTSSIDCPFTCLPDTGYEKDIYLVKKSLGSLVSTSVNNSDSWYWLASRYYGGTIKGLSVNGMIIKNDGSLYDSRFVGLNESGSSYAGDQYRCNSIRPILTLNSDIQIIRGDGKSASTAYQLS